MRSHSNQVSHSKGSRALARSIAMKANVLLHNWTVVRIPYNWEEETRQKTNVVARIELHAVRLPSHSSSSLSSSSSTLTASPTKTVRLFCVFYSLFSFVRSSHIFFSVRSLCWCTPLRTTQCHTTIPCRAVYMVMKSSSSNITVARSLYTLMWETTHEWIISQYRMNLLAYYYHHRAWNACFDISFVSCFYLLFLFVRFGELRCKATSFDLILLLGLVGVVFLFFFFSLTWCWWRTLAQQPYGLQRIHPIDAAHYQNLRIQICGFFICSHHFAYWNVIPSSRREAKRCAIYATALNEKRKNSAGNQWQEARVVRSYCSAANAKIARRCLE